MRLSRGDGSDANEIDAELRGTLPPDRVLPGVTTYDAKDPDSRYPPIKPAPTVRSPQCRDRPSSTTSASVSGIKLLGDATAMLL